MLRLCSKIITLEIRSEANRNKHINYVAGEEQDTHPANDTREGGNSTGGIKLKTKGKAGEIGAGEIFSEKLTSRYDYFS